MAFRDRFFTPATAKALLSWRILLGVGVGVAVALLTNPVVGVIGALAAYGVSVLIAMPRTRRTTIDPFTISEPWRRFVQGAQRSRRSLRQTLADTREGPLKDRLIDIAERLERAVEESWEIAKRGDGIDAAVTRIDPVRLRSQLATLERSAGSDDRSAAVASVESQLASADRLKALSATTADRLRLTQARLDELVARAAEVSVGASDTDTYEHDVDNLVVELEGLRLAVAEADETDETA